MKFFSVLPLSLAVLILPGISAAQSPHPITIEDRFKVQEVTDPQLSPNAQQVAYVVSTTSLKQDDSKDRIWMVPFGGGEAVALTADGVSSSHPRWSPDGKYLGFLSARNEGKT